MGTTKKIQKPEKSSKGKRKRKIDIEEEEKEQSNKTKKMMIRKCQSNNNNNKRKRKRKTKTKDIDEEDEQSNNKNDIEDDPNKNKRIRKCQTNNKRDDAKKIGTKEEDERIIQVGDTVNLSELLFTKKRNYLVKFNQTKRVKAEDLAGKVIVIIFLSLVHGSYYCHKLVKHLSDIYNKLHPTGSFEIVFVAFRDDITDEQTPTGSTPRKRFLERFSTMAWPAIPFSDLKSRKHLERIFGIGPTRIGPFSFIIDPRGVVTQCNASHLFSGYGAVAYPFTNERIKFLDSEANVARMNPSMKILFASPQCDYLITNKGDQVPIQNLEDKVVALYLCTDPFNKRFTMKLKMAYEELSKKKQDFEVVFIYMPCGWKKDSITDEYSFWKAFKRMPWLALPVEDTDCNKTLQRIFKYPQEQEALVSKQDPRLVIIGPHGKSIEPLGANILSKYGAAAYPFTLYDAVALELEKVKEVKLEMFWDLDAVFRKKNGSEVRFSQILGKRIIVLFQNWRYTPEWTLKDLKAMYFKMKGTDDEFEVIHIYDGNWSEKVAGAMPWLMHPPFGKETYAHRFIGRIFHGDYHGLVAFDRDGALVRRAKHLAVAGRRAKNLAVGDNMFFPFYNEKMDMELEVLLELERRLDRWPLD